MFNYIIKTLLELLTDFGPAALAIILITITYFDWRINKITKKLLETNFNLSFLEKDNLKKVQDVRADSQRDSQNILLISHMQGKTLTEAFTSLVSHVNQNAEAVIITHDAIQHFSEKLEQLEKASKYDFKLHSEFKRRYNSEYEELDGCVRSLERDLKSLQRTVGFHESIMQVREAGPIEVKPLVEPLSLKAPVWAAEEVLEAEDSLWPEEVREEVENPHSVGVAPVLAEQRERNEVTLFETAIDVVPDIDDLDKKGYELLLSGYIFDMKEQGLEIPTIEEMLHGNLGRTGIDADIVRFNETGLTARFGEGQEPVPGAYRRGD